MFEFLTKPVSARDLRSIETGATGLSTAIFGALDPTLAVANACVTTAMNPSSQTVSGNLAALGGMLVAGPVGGVVAAVAVTAYRHALDDGPTAVVLPRFEVVR